MRFGRFVSFGLVASALGLGGCKPYPGLIGLWSAEGSPDSALCTSESKALGSVSYVEGKLGQAFHFEGLKDAVEVEGIPSLSKFTVSFWIKPDKLIDRSETIARTFIARGDDNTIGTANNSGNIEIRGPQPRVYSKRFTWAPGRWHHLAVTFDGSEYRIYADGALEGSGKSDVSILADASQPLRLKHYQGALDEVSLYDRALTPDEVGKLNRGNGCAAGGNPDQGTCRLAPLTTCEPSQ